MSYVYLKVPDKKDLHYRIKWMQDNKTMSYNAGYEINVKGYNKKTGTITKTEEEMIAWYDNFVLQEPDKYYAYVYIDNVLEPIGEVYYYLEHDIHNMGILIQDQYRGKGYGYFALLELEKIAFQKNGIHELSDFIPMERIGAINIFKKAGFVPTNVKQKELKFGKECISEQLLLTKEMYDRRKVKKMDEIVFQSEHINYIKVSDKYIKDYLKMMNNPKIRKLLSANDKVFTYEDELNWVKSSREKIQFSMIDKESKKFIGNIGLMDVTDKGAEMGITITEEFQNKHYGSEAIEAIVQYGFETLGLEEINLIVFSHNERAIHCYQKLGFVVEKVEKNVARIDNRDVDDIYMKRSK